MFWDKKKQEKNEEEPDSLKKCNTLKDGVDLKVLETLQDDAYKGIARIDTEVMKQLGLKRGDVALIKGGRETVAIVDKAYPADVGEPAIRIDGIIRKNAKIGIGDVVRATKADVKEAKKITIAPTQKGIMVQADPEMLKPGLLGRAVIKGDIIVMGGTLKNKNVSDTDLFSDVFAEALSGMGAGGFGFSGFSQMKFVIVSVVPNQPCVITDNTEIVLNPKAVGISEGNIGRIIDEEDYRLPEDKLIEISTLPNLNGFHEVKNIEEIAKIVKAGYFVNKFKDKNTVIYTASNYFYKKKVKK